MKKQKVQAKINLETLAGGAFAEKLNEALMQVAENIQNPNTDATTKRQITVNIKFTPNKTRQMVGTQIAVTTRTTSSKHWQTFRIARKSRTLHNVADINVGNKPGGPSSPGKPKEDKNMLIINIVLALVAALLLFLELSEKKTDSNSRTSRSPS